MDAIAQLALMNKANQVFGGADSFLSFPIFDPISYKPEELDVAQALSSPAVAHAMADFSLNVNSLPAEPLFQGLGDSYLWQAYRQWLTDMVLAKDEMTAEEKTRYSQAKSVLTVNDASGLAADSPMVVAYKQYRDAWFSATQNYKNMQLTATSSSDPAVLDQWKSTDEPRLRALVDQAQSDWETKGNKAAVENAKAVVAQLEARLPSLVWAEWNSALNPDIDLLTDQVGNFTYAPTMFAPSNVIAQQWPTFSLSSDEIVQLSQSAPENLRQLFSHGSDSSTIVSLSFEFRSVALVRPWLNSAVFTARFWKFRDGVPPLSDGAVPPHGSWPCYVTGVVLVRNVQITTRDTPQRQRLRTLPVIKPLNAPTPQLQRVVMRRSAPALAGSPVLISSDLLKRVVAASYPAPPLQVPPVQVPSGGTTEGPLSPTGFAGAPAAVSRNGQVCNIYVRGLDNALWQRAYAGGQWNPWQRHDDGGVIMSEPALGSMGPDQEHVVARGSDDQVVRKAWKAGSGWSQWEPLGAPAGGFVGAPATISRNSQVCNIYVRGADNALWQCAYDGQWHPWQRHQDGGVLMAQPALGSMGPDHEQVFVRGTDEQVWQKYWTSGAGWSGWIPLGAPPVGFVGAPATVSRNSQVCNIYVRGVDNGLWQRAYAGGQWYPWQRHEDGGVIMSQPALASMGPNHESVSARGTDDQIWQKAWTAEAGWSAWLPLGAPPAPSTEVTKTDTDVSVLALICRRLPLAPNPDPSLSWGP